MAELKIEQIGEALATSRPHYLVRLLSTKGSTPRDAGATMLVGEDHISGTIGGGSAEWVAVQAVREFIAGIQFRARDTITLGPEIDQCCGGTIEVEYELLNEQNAALQCIPTIDETTRNVLIFGAGHTGLALANALSPLLVGVEIIDSRTSYAGNVDGHSFRNLAVPEEAVRMADSGSVFVVTTHDHSLDFLITAEALSREDAGYVGMIGSPTKRAVLKSWMAQNGYDDNLVENLHCPIGGSNVKNKQPEIIAAMCAAEILQAIETN